MWIFSFLLSCAKGSILAHGSEAVIQNMYLQTYFTYTCCVHTMLWFAPMRPCSSCTWDIIKRINYTAVIMSAMASHITSLTIVYSIVYSDADQRKHQSSALLAFVWGIHRGPVNSPHKWPVTRKMFPFDDVIKYGCGQVSVEYHQMFRSV